MVADPALYYRDGPLIRLPISPSEPLSPARCFYSSSPSPCPQPPFSRPEPHDEEGQEPERRGD